MNDIMKDDMVYLLSGGPAMVVVSIQGDNVTCRWFNKHGNLKHGVFDVEILTATDPGRQSKDDTIKT